MIQRPTNLAPQMAETFKDSSVVAAYRYRPAYPPETFEILTGLITSKPRRVLDVGCGTGYIARSLVEYVEQVDAVDFSPSMIAQGKQLPGGNHPRLNWLCGKVEEIALEPPYALVTAGESLHWMDWQIVLPRFGKLLTAGGYLALIGHQTEPDPWSLLEEILPSYRTDGGYQPFDLIEELERSHLFHKVGERQTASLPFVQSIDEYIESYHARAPFSRGRMGPDRAATFDEEARKILLRSYHDGIITLHVGTTVLWGIPKGPTP